MARQDQGAEGRQLQNRLPPPARASALKVAILFPKYKAGPINGDEVKEEDLQREKMKVDISALLGGDIYAGLAAAEAKAPKVPLCQGNAREARPEERKKCLAKLQEAWTFRRSDERAGPTPTSIRAKTRKARE